MLHLLIGEDKGKINSFIKKESGNQTALKLDTFTWDADLVRGLVESQSLFGGGDESLVLDSMSENEEALSLLMSFIEGMVSSKKNFFIIESDLAPESQELMEKKGAKVQDFRNKSQDSWKEAKFSKNQDKYNPFAIADAVGKKSAKEAWVEYQRARIAEASPEELHARVWSKVRDILSCQNATATELGVHPFVYKKAKLDMRNWTADKLTELADKLVDIYHLSRLGGDDLDTAMEKLLLNL